MRPVRVIICEDQEIVRDGLAAVLEREPDIHVVGTEATAEHALRLIPELEPDFAVVDLPPAGHDWCRAVREAQEQHSSVKVIILTSFLDEEVIVGAIEAEARGFAYKDVAALELKRAVRDVAEGRTLIDAYAAMRAFGRALPGRTHPDQASPDVR